MISLSVKGDIKNIIKRIGSVPDSIIKPAANRALNRAGARAHSDAVKRISDITGIKPQRKVKESIILTKSDFATLRVTIRALRKGINLIEFVTPSMRHPGYFNKRLKSGQHKHQGVKAKAWGKTKTYKGTFIGRGQNSGKALVLARTSSSRYPIKAIAGPSIRRTFIEREFKRSLLKLGRDVFVTEFNREVKYRLSKL